MAASDAVVDVKAAEEQGTTELAFSGSNKWDLVGRKDIPKAVAARGGSAAGTDFFGPVRLRFLGLPAGTAFCAVYSGAVAAHLVLVDSCGRAYGLGRNDNGQLARADLRSRRHPVRFELPVAEEAKNEEAENEEAKKDETIDEAKKDDGNKGEAKDAVNKAEEERVVHAACGRGHTVLVTSAGRAFACGSNSSGQLGTVGIVDLSDKNAAQLQRVLLPQEERVVCAAAGSDFTVFATASGAVYTAGNGQYGQLGNGRTGECIDDGNRLSFDIVPTPTRLRGFGGGDGEVRVTRVAAGCNHAMALDENGKVWTWGWGGFGRLGHKTPKDELRPRRVETFDYLTHKIDVIACGQASSFAACSGGKTLYFWGITKKSGESNMYPKPVYDLQGWEVRSLATGPTSTIVAAEKSVVSWGSSPTFGELGYGEGKPKSSTKPKIVDALEGLTVEQVAMGVAFSAMLLQVSDDADKKIVDKLPLEEVHVDDFENEDELVKGETKVKVKAKAKAKTSPSRGRKRKRKRSF